MEIEKLYSIADKEKIDVYNYKMQKEKARIISDETGTAIFMNYSDIGSSIEEKELITEELGHYYYSSFYSINSPLSEISRCEYKSKKWKFLTLCPVSSFQRCFSKGLKSSYEIAEELNVSEQTVTDAYNYYVSNKLIEKEDMYDFN